MTGKVAGVDKVYISRTGYTGEDGFELYFPGEHATKIWNALTASGEVTPTGLGARDSLRLEMGMALYGNDLDDTTTPLEASLGWLVKMKKGDFVGRDALAKQKEQGLGRKLVGFTTAEDPLWMSGVANGRRAGSADRTMSRRAASRSGRRTCRVRSGRIADRDQIREADSGDGAKIALHQDGSRL